MALKLCLIKAFRKPSRNILAFSLLLLNASCTVQPNRPPDPAGYIPPLAPVSASDEQYGHELLSQLSQKYQLDFNHPRRSSVDIVVQKLTSTIGGSNQPWHVNVFADPKVKNAAATKGNHIFLWTGMIDATQNDDELAGVLAHEIGHILAHHTESSSGETARELLVGIGSFAAGAAASILTNGAMGSNIASQIASSLTKEVGSGLLIYPYSRDKENQADEIGLYLMTKAGYRPEAAIDFWTRALGDPDFSSSVAFLSTHPPAQDRLTHLKTILPIALNLKNGNSSIVTPGNWNSMQNPANPIPLPTPNHFPPPQIHTPTPPTSTGPLPSSDSFDIRK